jgi:hypothetical protein
MWIQILDLHDEPIIRPVLVVSFATKLDAFLYYPHKAFIREIKAFPLWFSKFLSSFAQCQTFFCMLFDHSKTCFITLLAFNPISFKNLLTVLWLNYCGFNLRLYSMPRCLFTLTAFLILPATSWLITFFLPHRWVSLSESSFGFYR